mmetsp:Transcript_8178/g.17289  ORF Transcript_8178/g.17289 Transcript_8178/m.17289 type:complete len:262 (-) Transcript_8178:123-908(-)
MTGRKMNSFLCAILVAWGWFPVVAEGFVLVKPNAKPAPFGESTIQLALFRSKRKDGSIPDPVVDIESHVDWMELLEDDERVIAVNFHASWCKFCRKFRMKWDRKVVRPMSDRVDQTTGKVIQTGRGVQFAAVEYSANKKLCQSLQIGALPTVQFYWKGKMLASLPCGPREISSLPPKLMWYLEARQGELEQIIAVRSARKQGPDESRNIVPVEIQDDEDDDGGPSVASEETQQEEIEPKLYLRKRDRLKKKLVRGDNTAQT